MISRLFCCASQALYSEYHLYVWTIQNDLLIQQNFRTEAAASKAFLFFKNLYDQHQTFGRIALLEGEDLLLKCDSRVEDVRQLHLPLISPQIRKCLQVKGLSAGSEMKQNQSLHQLKTETIEPSRCDTAHNLIHMGKKTGKLQSVLVEPKSALKSTTIAEEDLACGQSELIEEQKQKGPQKIEPVNQITLEVLPRHDEILAEALNINFGSNLENTPFNAQSKLPIDKEFREIKILPKEKPECDPFSSGRNYRFRS